MQALGRGLSYRQGWMMSGHTDPKTVMRYDHHRENLDQNAVNLFSITAAVFGQYKMNPEDFIRQAATIINEQKATVIVEHLTYDPITAVIP